MLSKLLKFTGAFVLSIVMCSVTFSKSNTPYNLFSQSDNSVNSQISSIVDNAVFMNINRSELERLCDSREQEIEFSIPYKNGQTAFITLQRSDILKPGAKIVTRTARGNEEVQLRDLAVSYTGKLPGYDNSLISITFAKDKVTGILVAQNDNYILGNIKDNSGNETDTYILYKETDLKVKNNFQCFTDDNLSSEAIEEMRNKIITKLNDNSPTDLYVAEIAIEIDFATYNIYGASMTNTTNYALALMAASSAIYMKEVNVKFVIPYLRVWTVADPYTGTNSNTLLNQFRAEWTANQQSVQRTLAHFITRRGGNYGGIAWVNVLCSSVNGGNGYGFSNTDGPILPLPTYSWDVMVVSHEIGHNFGSPHTHNCSWVGGIIDSCYTPEGGCYTGPQVPAVGTIMSYCHLNGSISLVKGFGPQPRALIRTNAENASCMFVSARELQVGYPNGGELFRTGNSTQIYWGTSLTGNVNIELSTDNGSTWQNIQSNIPATQRIFDWTIPYIGTTSQAKIRIVNSSNLNQGDTCDNSFSVILNYIPFTIVSPVSFSRIETSPTGNTLHRFDWTSAGTHPSFRYGIKIRKIGAGGVDYFYSSDNGGSDTAVTFRNSFLDSLALAIGTTGDSVRCSWRSWAYNGYDSAQSTNSGIVTFARTNVGINVISSSVPENFELYNNYPNPFNPSTNIKFNIAKSGIAELKVYDAGGRQISILVNENLSPGSYEYRFDAVNLPSGVYFYTLRTRDFTSTKKMVLLK
ncbi:MAG: zinc-dependent metalloprotease [Bacteroidetes bacterium]|nr:zinc-dependent metalloprotease [Bacteroidota bacterium]